MKTLSRPILPPLRYVLFMPWRGMYVQALATGEGTFQATGDGAQACALPEPEARAAGLDVIHATGEPVELRPVELH